MEKFKSSLSAANAKLKSKARVQREKKHCWCIVIHSFSSSLFTRYFLICALCSRFVQFVEIEFIAFPTEYRFKYQFKMMNKKNVRFFLFRVSSLTCFFLSFVPSRISLVCARAVKQASREMLRTNETKVHFCWILVLLALCAN